MKKEFLCSVLTTNSAGPVMTQSNRTTNLDHRNIARKTEAKLMAYQNYSAYMYIAKTIEVRCSVQFFQIQIMDTFLEYF